jgi:hypothetical protein
METVAQQQTTGPVVQQGPAGSVIQQQLTGLIRKHAIAASKYVVKLVTDVFHLCGQFISCALGIAILLFLFSIMTSQLASFTRPICHLPVVSPIVPFCRWEVFKGPQARIRDKQPIRWAGYPRLIDTQTRTFGQLLDERVGNSGLALEVKKTEMASNDLINLMRVSDLKSKDQVVETLGRFADEARGAGQSLYRLGTKIHGAVNS